VPVQIVNRPSRKSGVREIGGAVLGPDHPDADDSFFDIALVAQRHLRRLVEGGGDAVEDRARVGGIWSRTPLDLDGVHGLHRLPGVPRDGGDGAVTDGHDAGDARHPQRPRRVVREHRRAEMRVRADRGVEHPGQADVDAKLGGARNLRLHVEAGERATEQPPFGARLQRRV
jgi:hypothetical protein